MTSLQEVHRVLMQSLFWDEILENTVLLAAFLNSVFAPRPYTHRLLIIFKPLGSHT